MEDTEGLRQRAIALRAAADALTRGYRRATWLRFTLVFFPVPFLVVLLRLQLESWHYFVLGGAYKIAGASVSMLRPGGAVEEACTGEPCRPVRVSPAPSTNPTAERGEPSRSAAG